MITPEKINTKQGFRYLFENNNIVVESTACKLNSLPEVVGYQNPMSLDSKNIIKDACFVQIVTKNIPKKIRQPGAVRCGGGLLPPTNIQPGKAPWSGPVPGTDIPTCKVMPIPEPGDPESIDSKQVYADILNKYINNEGIPPYAKLTYKNLDGQDIECSNPSKDFSDCFGYALNSIPNQELQNRLKAKTGNSGDVLPHRLKIECSYSLPECSAKLEGPIQMKKFICKNLSPTLKTRLKSPFNTYNKYASSAVR
jgi:hypothetical protein